MRAAALGREHVHLPRILAELHARRGGDRLAFVHQSAHEVAEVARPVDRGEVRVVRQARQCGDGVDGGVEDQLRPLRGPQIVERLGLQPGCDDQVGDHLRVVGRRAARRPDPGGGVEDVLDVRVLVARAAHERDRGQQAPVAVPSDHLVRADPVLHGHHDRVGPVTGEARRDRVEIEGLAGDDHELRLGQLLRRGGGSDPRR